ncbi:MAG: prolyl 4-hydroxylase [Bacillariaceae sp.]
MYPLFSSFPSDECKEVIRLGLEQGLEQSTLHSSSLARQNRDNSTRSSTNAWLSGDTNSLTKKIYQKAAKLSNIDSNLFQNFHESSGAHYHSIAESLQVVRYKKGEEYTPHHDFVSPSINDRYQPSRFATLLIYLNDVEEGGETRFPRAVNNYNAEGLEIKPKAGTAVLFYNMLEDGNFDDLSQHGGNKVLKGNKWLANLWVSSISIFSLTRFIIIIACRQLMFYVRPSHIVFTIYHILIPDLGSRDWMINSQFLILTNYVKDVDVDVEIDIR